MSRNGRHVDLTLALLLGAGSREKLACAAVAQDEASLWRDLIAFASAQLVLPALARSLTARSVMPAMPPEAEEFILACSDANRARNQTLLAALGSAGETLGAIGVTPIALKGAAFLAEDSAQDFAAWRFMQDIDILVPADRLEACVAALRLLGFTPATNSYDPGREAHYPPLVSRCGTFSIEVHSRLFAFGAHELGPNLVTEQARPSRLLGSGVLVPSPRHRLMHVLAHAQLHNRNYARRRIVLKDLLDLDAIEEATGCLDPCFAGSHARAAAEALLAARGLVKGDDTVWPWPARRWARQALARLSWSRWRRQAATPLDLLTLEAYRLRHEPGHFVRRLGLMTSRERRSEAVSAWLSKERQYLWQ